MYDFILCGSGPAAAAWLRSTLRHAPGARILLMERGPYSKTDVLTERNPFRALRASKQLLASYNHGVMQVRRRPQNRAALAALPLRPCPHRRRGARTARPVCSPCV